MFQHLVVTIIHFSSVLSPVSSEMDFRYEPPNHTHTLFFFFFLPLPRIPRGVSMETRKRQWSVSQPKVHPVGEGGSPQVLQQAGCKQDHIDGVYLLSKANNTQEYLTLTVSCLLFLPASTKARDPKAVMKIETLNATFQPAKIGNPCGLQITYLKDNSTRNIFVYHSDAKVHYHHWHTC